MQENIHSKWLGGEFMVKLFIWFYCLPIEGVLVLVLLASLVFFFLREKFNNTLYWKVGVLVLLVCWMAVILFATVGQRTKDVNSLEPVLQPFASYLAVLNGGTKEFLRANFMNITLFYPAGLLGCEALPKQWNKYWKLLLNIAIFLLLSIGIEHFQYRFGLGQAEIDDVIHNTLGVLIGGIVSRIRKSK